MLRHESTIPLNANHSPGDRVAKADDVPRRLSIPLLFSVWTLVGLSFSALSYASAVTEGRPISLAYALAMNLTRFYLWALLSILLFRLASAFLVQLRPFRPFNAAINLLGLVLFAVIHQAIFLIIGWQVAATRVRFDSLVAFYRVVFVSGLYLDILIALLIVITSHALIFYRNYRTGEFQRSLLKGQLAEAELHALKMQLHPHFLFNTLHSISALVQEDPARANLMISRLGDFLRLTLEESQATVPLREELDFLKCYLEIEQIRFQDRLTIEFEVHESVLSATVPHLIFQPLVENAIKHGAAARSAPSRIIVRAHQSQESVQLEVEDDGPGLQNVTSPMGGLGITNVRARLKQIYGSNCQLDFANSPSGGVCVSVTVPLNSYAAVNNDV